MCDHPENDSNFAKLKNNSSFLVAFFFFLNGHLQMRGDVAGCSIEVLAFERTLFRNACGLCLSLLDLLIGQL